MNGYLKQSTASQVRSIGPFVDDTDFKTLENALSIANTDIKIKKNGAASGNKNSGGATADGSGGLYAVTWDATDTATVGELYFSIKVSGALVVFGSYVVLEEAVYDSLYASAAPGYIVDQPVNTTKWAGTTVTTGDIAIKTTLAKTTHITGFNDLSAANVNTECDTALSDIQLDHLIQTADPGGVVANNSFLAKLCSKSATAAFSSYDNTTDSAEAIRDRGDAAWVTGAGGDPWATALPGAYSAGQAGKIIGDNITATISSRATPAQVASELSTYGALKPTTAGRTLDVTATGEAGVDFDNTAGTLAKGTDIIGFNDLSAAAVNAEVDTALADIHLDHLIASADPGGVVANSSFLAKLVSKSATPAFTSYDNTTDSHEAIRDNMGTPQTGDSFARIGANGAGLTALGDTRIANLDATVSSRASQTSLNTVDDFLDTEVSAILAAVDTEIAAIKAVTDKLDTGLVLDGAVYQWTVNALELGPSGGSAPSAATIADAVWDETLSGHLTAGTTGAALNGAGSAGDPWGTSLPGAYTSGQAGKIVGDFLNASVSSRATQTSVDAIDDFLDTEVAAILADTNELQVDWVNGGRLDLLIDAIKAKTDALPTDPADASDIAASFSSLTTLVNTLTGYVDTEVAAIKSKTDNLPSDPADASDLAALLAVLSAQLTTIDTVVDSILADTGTDGVAISGATATQVADALLARDIGSGTNAGTLDERTVRSALRFIRNKWNTTEVADTLTVKKENDTTTAWTAPLSTDAGATPITGMDPV